MKKDKTLCTGVASKPFSDQTWRLQVDDQTALEQIIGHNHAPDGRKLLNDGHPAPQPHNEPTIHSEICIPSKAQKLE
jgi:hypothetical protein